MDGCIARFRTFRKTTKTLYFIRLNFSLASSNRGAGECHVVSIGCFDDGLHIFGDAQVYRGYFGEKIFQDRRA